MVYIFSQIFKIRDLRENMYSAKISSFTVYIYIYIFIYIYTYIYIYIYIAMYVYVCMHVCMCACVCTNVCVGMYMHMYGCILHRHTLIDQIDHPCASLNENRNSIYLDFPPTAPVLRQIGPTFSDLSKRTPGDELCTLLPLGPVNSTLLTSHSRSTGGLYPLSWGYLTPIFKDSYM